MTPLLTIEDLRVTFTQYTRGLRRRELVALDGMNLTADRGQVVALVGASGAGKTLLAHAVLGILPPNASLSGTITYDSPQRDIAFLPQSVDYLDPLATVGRQVRRSARLAGRTDARQAAAAALEARGLGVEVLRRYSHELSGGMVRRVLVTMALFGDPELVIADEPTPGLPAADVAAVLGDLRELADDGRAVVLITHELRGALEIADQVVICQDGRTVECTEPAAFVEGRLMHPYTRALWKALPANGFEVSSC
ncbi:ATP-binding cassette domain-containing protein [Kribbella sp. WER1]